MTTWEVYALSDPRTRAVCYVGMTSIGVNKRVKMHHSSPSNWGTHYWLEQLRKRGASPVVKVLSVIDAENRTTAKSEEKKWIHKMIAEGHPLTNVHHVKNSAWLTGAEKKRRAKAERAAAAGEGVAK